jgi:O-acetyl-ADP-ribose deacetylase (regulator of RNase III)
MVSLILMATDEFTARQFEKQFAGISEVTVHRGVFQQLDDIDCLVSPANSFGIMDGGMDAAITAYFGDRLQARVQRRIIDEYAGEQPVGTSLIVDTYYAHIRFLAHTPTMRVPSVISGTDNVYRATKAMLNEVNLHPHIYSVACPALGAGAGRVHPAKVAYQMALAYEHVANPPRMVDWRYARTIAYEIEGGR